MQFLNSTLQLLDIKKEPKSNSKFTLQIFGQETLEFCSLLLTYLKSKVEAKTTNNSKTAFHLPDFIIIIDSIHDSTENIETTFSNNFYFKINLNIMLSPQIKSTNNYPFQILISKENYSLSAPTWRFTEYNSAFLKIKELIYSPPISDSREDCLLSIDISSNLINRITRNLDFLKQTEEIDFSFIHGYNIVHLNCVLESLNRILGSESFSFDVLIDLLIVKIKRFGINEMFEFLVNFYSILQESFLNARLQFIKSLNLQILDSILNEPFNLEKFESVLKDWATYKIKDSIFIDHDDNIIEIPQLPTTPSIESCRDVLFLILLEIYPNLNSKLASCVISEWSSQSFELLKSFNQDWILESALYFSNSLFIDLSCFINVTRDRALDENIAYNKRLEISRDIFKSTYASSKSTQKRIIDTRLLLKSIPDRYKFEIFTSSDYKLISKQTRDFIAINNTNLELSVKIGDVIKVDSEGIGENTRTGEIGFISKDIRPLDNKSMKFISVDEIISNLLNINLKPSLHPIDSIHYTTPIIAFLFHEPSIDKFNLDLVKTKVKVKSGFDAVLDKLINHERDFQSRLSQLDDLKSVSLLESKEIESIFINSSFIFQISQTLLDGYSSIQMANQLKELFESMVFLFNSRFQS